MGQQNNSRRNATLDEHKLRAAGRQQNRPEVEEMRNWRGPKTDPTATGGAYGRGGKGNRAGMRGSGGRSRTDAGSPAVRRSSRARKKSKAS